MCTQVSILYHLPYPQYYMYATRNLKVVLEQKIFWALVLESHNLVMQMMLSFASIDRPSLNSTNYFIQLFSINRLGFVGTRIL